MKSIKLTIDKCCTPMTNYILMFILMSCMCIACGPSGSGGIDKSDKQRIYLVRHAEKAVTKSSDPSISAAGKQRAERLADMLEDKNISKIYASYFNRTIATAAPLAKRIDVEVMTYRLEDDFLFKMLSLLGNNENALVVGHSNSIPQMVNKLTKSNKYQELAENEYDKLFVLTANGEGYDVEVKTY